MCVIVPCADPKVPGVYWRENDRWVQYPADLADKILAARRNAGTHPQGSIVHMGAIASVVHPGGDPYSVDVTAMKQRNTRSQYTRDVKIVEDVSTNGAVSTVQIQGLRVWRAPVRHDGSIDHQTWQQYSQSVSGRILNAFASGQSSVTVTAQDGSRCVVDTALLRATHYPVDGGLNNVLHDASFESDPCSICCGGLVDPLQLSCGHAFCGACITKWTAIASAGTGNICPFRCHESQHMGPTPMSRTESFIVNASTACDYEIRLVLTPPEEETYQAIVEKFPSIIANAMPCTK